MDNGLQLRAQTGAAGIALPHRIHLNQRHGLMVNGDWRVDLRMRSLGLRFHRITGPTPTGILKINSFVSAGYGTPLAAKSSQQKTYPQIPHSRLRHTARRKILTTKDLSADSSQQRG